MVDHQSSGDGERSSRRDGEDDDGVPSSRLRRDPGQSLESHLQRLRIELRRIRQKATAARLEAHAANIELQIETVSKQIAAAARDDAPKVERIRARSSLAPTISYPRQRFESWDDVRREQDRRRERVDHSTAQLRFDGPSKPHPHFGHPASPESIGSDSETSQASEASFTLPEVPADDRATDTDRASKKSRPMAMIVSTIAHVVVILILAGFTLSTHRPKDQISITASPSTVSEVAMETFSIETSEPEVTPTEPTESATEYELSPIGEIAVAEFSSDAAPLFASPSVVSQMTSGAAASAAAMSLSSAVDAKIQFCGVEGGGNHFVYLVDSSGSMGAGFDSARRELLESIEFLKPDQRFYVIFFDANPDFMRLASSTVDEPRSVEATPQSKLALKRWAMQIKQDRGKNPYEVLEFALTLKPDVIFLLSDGEFPQRIEELLQQKNRTNNLFGDDGPMCIVHTIGYHSEEGETRMRRIAEKNGGQYRYVPRP